MKTSRTRRGNYSKGITRVCIFTLGILVFLGLLLLPFAESIAQLSLNRYLPVILNNANPGRTDTFTPTGTLPSPTVTNTFGPSPTNTLTPSPTFTGTITPVPSITISVYPVAGAKVNEILTFTITVKNTGTSPTHNNVVVDSFTVSYIDVTDVPTTKGTVVNKTL